MLALPLVLLLQVVSRPDSLRAASASAAELRLDGHLDEAAWLRADSLHDFLQREPHEGAPASERTIVRVLRTADALWVGVRLEDRTPSGIIATQLRRDADLMVDDDVTLIIDSFHERRGAFVFRTNPLGAMWDAQLNGFEDLNVNWNGIWAVGTSRDSAGWTAEFRIPFSTLRFRRGEAIFGFNVSRFLRRKTEASLWRSWRRAQGIFQLLEAGQLTGLGTPPNRRQVDIRPYVLGRAVEPAHDLTGAVDRSGDLTGKAGIDAKIAVLPTLTADLTVNTDFAQVEADRQIINLTRFPTFFPEKREFFLESSGLFSFGTRGRAQLFYSRRIGLRDGVPVPILGGARVYGKVGPWDVGALAARTGEGEEAGDFVLRVRHDLLERAHIGAMATERSARGGAGAERAAGLDIDLPLVIGGQNLEPSFWIAGSRVPGVEGTPRAWRFGTDFPNDLFDNFVSLYRIDEGFTPALGFVRRTGILETTGHVDFTPRPRGSPLGILRFEFKPIPSWDIITPVTGSLAHSRDWETASFEFEPFGAEFVNGSEIHLNIQRLLDAPTDSFAVFRDVTIAPGRYWWTRAELQVGTSPARPFALNSEVSVGNFYDGTSTRVGVEGTWRPGGHLILGASFATDRVRLPGASFNTAEAVLRTEYAFDTRTDFLAFVQTNNEDERVDFNIRFHWIPRIGDDLYIVWNSGYATARAARFRFPSVRAITRPLDGALVVKAVHRLAW